MSTTDRKLGRAIVLLFGVMAVAAFAVSASKEPAKVEPTKKESEADSQQRAARLIVTAQIEADQILKDWADPQSKSKVTTARIAGLEHLINMAPKAGPDISQLLAAYKKVEDLRNPVWERERKEVAERRRIAKKTREEDVSGRTAFAKSMETLYLDKGMDVYVTTEGSKATTIRLRYVLMSRPLVYKFSNDSDILARLAKLGFRKIIYTDGYNHQWSQEIPSID